MRILILGSSGQLGRCLKDQLTDTNFEVIYATKANINLEDLLNLRTKIFKINPNIIINASAYTEVDNAENETVKANTINHLAVANVASICRELKSWFIHISTDYVFDGMRKGSYSENSETNPQSIYGKTKLDGEVSIRESDCNYIIIRTSWLFSEYGENFFKTILRLGSKQKKLSIVGDQVGCPTYAQDLAKAIVSILPRLTSKGFKSDLFHYCGDNSCSWHQFANVIFSEANDFGFKIPNSVKRIETINYPTRANRPLNSILDCSKISRICDIPPSDWRKAVGLILQKMKVRDRT